jgi:pimeloyl-ACP methyl ester carboxylesterase
MGVGTGAVIAMHWAARDPRVRAIVAISPDRQFEPALLRTARHRNAAIEPEVLHEALELAGRHLELRWDDWSGEAAARQLKHPVLFIGGGKDMISATEDVEQLKQSAPAGSRTLVIPPATRRDVAYWFHESAAPITAWFDQQLGVVPQ